MPIANETGTTKDVCGPCSYHLRRGRFAVVISKYVCVWLLAQALAFEPSSNRWMDLH